MDEKFKGFGGEGYWGPGFEFCVVRATVSVSLYDMKGD